MDNKPFSSPSHTPLDGTPPPSVSVGTTPTQNIKPPTADYNTTTPMITTVNPAVQTIILPQKESHTRANIFMGIGCFLTIIGLILGGAGALMFPDIDEVGELKVVEFQPLMDETIIFLINGTTNNKSFELNPYLEYNVRLAQGVEINSITISEPENNNSLFSEERCVDSIMGEFDDGIDECEDYTTISIGNIDFSELLKTNQNETVTVTININATGDVSIHNFDDAFWEEIFVANEKIDSEQYGGPLLMICFAPCGLCFGIIMLLVGLIVRFA